MRGIEWLKAAQKRIQDAPSILVVGGGALGVRESNVHIIPRSNADMDGTLEYATDIADAYPEKSVTLLHSRDKLLPQYPQALHDSSTSKSILGS